MYTHNLTRRNVDGVDMLVVVRLEKLGPSGLSYIDKSNKEI